MYNAKCSGNTGDWSNGMIGVSKTFGGSSILSSPAVKACRDISGDRLFFGKIQHDGCFFMICRD